MYLAEHPESGKALFTKLSDAMQWLSDQHRYHVQSYDDPEDIREALKTKWVSGGEHGWHALVSAVNPRCTFAAIMELVPDWEVTRHAPEFD